MVMLQAEKIMIPIKQSSTISDYSLTQVMKLFAQLLSFLHTLYLFTANDFATFALPTTLFAFFGSLSGPVLTTNATPSLLSILLRLPTSLLLIWTNLLIFNISNQRAPSAVEEDKINKPHRPLPSGRITAEASRRLLLVGIPMVLILGWVLGCWQETLLLSTATWMYNDLGGCDENFVLRNLLIAIGYGLYSSAALRVMTGPEYTLTTKGMQWIVLVTLVMFITQHICDIKDTEGDRVRGRRSAPIVLGDEGVRQSVAVPVILCSLACPAFFGLGIMSYIATMAIGGVVAGRTLVYTDLKSDKLTWKLWALWTCGLFVLPLVAEPDAIVQSWKSLMGIVCREGECDGALSMVAVTGITLAVEGRRLYASTALSTAQGNGTVPRIVVESVIS